MSPRRPHLLRARRLKLGVSQYFIGCLSYLKPYSAQSMVSYIERHESTVSPGRVRMVRAAIIWLETESRRAREAARVEAAASARIEEILAAQRGAEGDKAIVERLVDLLLDGRCEDFDSLAARVDPMLVETAGEQYLDASTPVIQPLTTAGGCAGHPSTIV